MLFSCFLIPGKAQVPVRILYGSIKMGRKETLFPDGQQSPAGFFRVLPAYRIFFAERFLLLGFQIGKQPAESGPICGLLLPFLLLLLYNAIQIGEGFCGFCHLFPGPAIQAIQAREGGFLLFQPFQPPLTGGDPFP